jgi:hypothetical protein
VSRPQSRRWTALTLLGLVAWIAVTVVAGVIADDPSDPRPTLLTFAAGGALFFGAIFATAWWQTRPTSDPALEALLAELALEPSTGGVAAIGAMRRVARAYIALGALVTALGLAATLQEALELGSARLTLYAMVAIVVVWALAVPAVLRRANAASAAVLAPLGLSQSGASLAGERHGHAVRVELTAQGSTTRVAAEATPTEMSGDELLAYAGRGELRTWQGVTVSADGERITIRRQGHDGAAWLWDLWLADRLAAG